MYQLRQYLLAIVTLWKFESLCHIRRQRDERKWCTTGSLEEFVDNLHIQQIMQNVTTNQLYNISKTKLYSVFDYDSMEYGRQNEDTSRQEVAILVGCGKMLLIPQREIK